jgi:hypothetical protein
MPNMGMVPFKIRNEMHENLIFPNPSLNIYELTVHDGLCASCECLYPANEVRGYAVLRSFMRACDQLEKTAGTMLYFTEI